VDVGQEGSEGTHGIGGDVGLGGDATWGGGLEGGSNTSREARICHRRMRVPIILTQLSIGSYVSISEYETNVEDNAKDETLNMNGIKYLYVDETWSKNNFTYDPPLMTISGRKGTM
jgi:hypothetical protein